MATTSWAGVVELADTPDLGSGASRLGGSSPPSRTHSRNTSVSNFAVGTVQVVSARARFCSALKAALFTWLFSVGVSGCSFYNREGHRKWELRRASEPACDARSADEVDRSLGSPAAPINSSLAARILSFQSNTEEQYLSGWRSLVSGIREVSLPDDVSHQTDLGGNQLIPAGPQKWLAVVPWEGRSLPVIQLLSESDSGTKFTTIFDPASVNAAELAGVRLSADNSHLAASLTTKNERGVNLLIVALSAPNEIIFVHDHIHSFEWSGDSENLFFVTEENRRPTSLWAWNSKTYSKTHLYATPSATADLLIRGSGASSTARTIESTANGDSFVEIDLAGSIVSSIKFTPHQLIKVRPFKSENVFLIDDPINGSRIQFRDSTRYTPSNGFSIVDLEVLNHTVVALEKKGAQNRITWFDLVAGDTGARSKLISDGLISRLPHTDSESRVFRFSLSSLARPKIRLELNLESSELKEEWPSIDGLTKSKLGDWYQERLPISATGTTSIDLLVALPKSSLQPLLNGVVLRSYGAYGVPPAIAEPQLDVSLLEDRIAPAVAFVHGGNEYGARERQNSLGPGKRLAVDELIGAAEELVNRGVVSSGKVILEAESAGAVAATTAFLERPELFAGLVLSAPLLDVDRIMLDTSLPGHERELVEWRNSGPSPIELIRKRSYPPIFISYGTRDTIVPAWSIARWIYRYRCVGLPENIVITYPFAGYEHERNLSYSDLFEYQAKRQTFIKKALLDS